MTAEINQEVAEPMTAEKLKERLQREARTNDDGTISDVSYLGGFATGFDAGISYAVDKLLTMTVPQEEYAAVCEDLARMHDALNILIDVMGDKNE